MVLSINDVALVGQHDGGDVNLGFNLPRLFRSPNGQSRHLIQGGRADFQNGLLASWWWVDNYWCRITVK